MLSSRNGKSWVFSVGTWLGRGSYSTMICKAWFRVLAMVWFRMKLTTVILIIPGLSADKLIDAKLY